jgi:tetratricopeptide (TPR) repeat protein
MKSSGIMRLSIPDSWTKNCCKNGYFPPANTIDVIKADNVPLCAIVQADPEQNALKANEFMKANNFDSAIVYYDRHFKKNPNDESSYDNYAIALANKGRIPEALAATKQKLKFTPRDLQTYELQMKIYQAIRDTRGYQEAASQAQAIVNEEQSE